MTAQTLTLADFLLARIAEDEAAARHMLGFGTEHTEHYSRPGATFDRWSVRRDEDQLIVEAHLGIFRPRPVLRVHHLDGDLADYIARWDPARVLAECEAKKTTVGLYREVADLTSLRRPGTVMPHEHARVAAVQLPALEGVLRLLALPYASHPDYRQEWRP